jgi:RNA polymerase sigma-70 factor (ECF subfamily)
VFFQGQTELIAHALDQIEDVYLDVLLLVAGPGFSYEEISIALGIPVGTVRSRLSRARRQLRELLGGSGQYLDEESPVERPSISTEGSP